MNRCSVVSVRMRGLVQLYGGVISVWMRGLIQLYGSVEIV